MSVFDNIRSKLLSYFNTNNEISSKWIKINDKRASCGWTIEDFPYETGVDENLTDTHCWKCVTVNQCWFKNEENKKPKPFDYSKYSFTEIPKSKRGLYHPNCHCKEKNINIPKLNDIILSIPRGKFNNFFNKKKKWFYSWGYSYKDQDMFMVNYYSLVKASFRQGNYQCEEHTKFGFKINISINVRGVGEKSNREYPVKACFIIFPEGKLRSVTIIGGESK